MHLAPPGSSSCDYGISVTKDECEAAAKSLWPNPQTGLQVGSGGTCLNGGWGQVPLGCSVNRENGASHYKFFGDDAQDCVHQNYQLVCRDKSKFFGSYNSFIAFFFVIT